MNALTPEQRRTLRLGNIGDFFRYYRARRANAAEIFTSGGKFAPDVHVLIGAGIDALSKSWVENIASIPASTNAPERWQAFLCQHANKDGIMDRVSVPMLADDLEARGKTADATVVRRVGRDNRTALVRFVEETDPLATEFAANTDITPLGIEKDVMRFRFGCVLYVEHRCEWNHRMLPSRKLAASDADTRTGFGRDYVMRVRYENFDTVITASGELAVKRLRPIFTVEWLLQRWGDALESYEAECIARDRDPVAAGGLL